MKASLSLGRISGIEIGVHFSWLWAAGLIAWTLAEGFFPRYYPEWSTPTYWLTGILSSLLLFMSILVHELAHSLVARSRGLGVEGITLFIFGGVSRLGGEPEKPRDEFVIAVVGPVTSLVLAGFFWGLYLMVADQNGPLEGILRYLGVINALVALFNILPGFPMDGGRVLRAIIWAVSGSMVKATNVATAIGQLFGWLLILWGIFEILQGRFFAGLWIAFIGWFLNSAAQSSRREVAIQEGSRGIKVSDVMSRDTACVSPQTTVEELVRDHFLRLGRRAMPVCEGGELLGIVTMADVKKVPQERWGLTQTQAIMTRDPLHTLTPQEDLAAALKMMTQHNVNQVLVRDEGRLVGMLNRAHIMNYMQGLKELGLTSTFRRNDEADGRTPGRPDGGR